MDLQKTILDQYMQLNGEPSWKKVAADTGIQITRVYRIFNGSTMKLYEYQIFNKKVKERLGLTNGLEEVAFECSLHLKPEVVRELEAYLRRKIKTWALIQTQIEPTADILTA